MKRLKNQINDSKEDKDYLIDKLNNQVLTLLYQRVKR